MLVNCVAYEEGRKLADVEPSDIHSYLARPGGFVWVALRDASDAELAAMQQQFDLHPLAVEDARHGHQRPKIEEYGDSLFVAMHVVEPAADELKVGEMAVFVGRNYVLSVRSQSGRGFQDVRARCEREPELLKHGPGYVLYALMDAVVDRYFPLIDALETELESLEANIFTGKGLARDNIESLYSMRQKLTTLKHAAGPLLEGVGKLYGGRVPPICQGLQDYFRDVYDHLVRINQAMDSMRDTGATAISVYAAMASVQQGDTTRKLAAGAALVAVPTMIAGVYGMNFRHIPELSWEFGYPLALSLMVGLDLLLLWRFRKAGWL
jgi:magnesium transporter